MFAFCKLNYTYFSDTSYKKVKANILYKLVFSPYDWSKRFML